MGKICDYIVGAHFRKKDVFYVFCSRSILPIDSPRRTLAESLGGFDLKSSKDRVPAWELVEGMVKELLFGIYASQIVEHGQE